MMSDLHLKRAITFLNTSHGCVVYINYGQLQTIFCFDELATQEKL